MTAVRPGSRGIDRLKEILSRRLWLGALAFLGVGAVGLTIVVAIPDVYQSSTTVLVQQTSAAGVEARLEMIREKILARQRLEELIRRFGLYPDLSKRLSDDAVIGQMRRDVELVLQRAEHPLGTGPIISFKLSHRGARDPQTSADITNEIAGFVVEEDARLRSQKTGASAESLKVQLDSIRGRLQAQEGRLGGLRAQLEMRGEADVALTALRSLSAQRETLAEERTRLRERRAELARRLELIDPDARQPATAEERLEALRLELAELRRRYSDKYPDVIRVRQQIAALESRLAARGAPRDTSTEAARLREALGELDAEMRAIGSEESRLRNAVTSHYRRLENPAQQQALLEAARDYETTKALYDQLLKQYEEAVLAAEEVGDGAERPQLRVLDPALPPKEPVAPNRVRLLVMALLVACFAAFGAVAVAEHLDTSFHTLEELRGFTRVPVLASIPRITTAADARRRGLRIALASAGSALGLALVVRLTFAFAYGNEYLAFLLGGGS